AVVDALEDEIPVAGERALEVSRQRLEAEDAEAVVAWSAPQDPPRQLARRRGPGPDAGRAHATGERDEGRQQLGAPRRQLIAAQGAGRCAAGDDTIAVHVGVLVIHAGIKIVEETHFLVDARVTVGDVRRELEEEVALGLRQYGDEAQLVDRLAQL